MQGSEAGDDVRQEGGLVAFATQGLRREEGGVGFDQEAIERDIAGELAQCVGLAEGEGAGEAEEVAEFEGLCGDSGGGGEGMQDADAAGERGGTARAWAVSRGSRSAAASRLWMMTGRLRSAASDSWWRRA